MTHDLKIASVVSVFAALTALVMVGTHHLFGLRAAFVSGAAIVGITVLAVGGGIVLRRVRDVVRVWARERRIHLESRLATWRDERNTPAGGHVAGAVMPESPTAQAAADNLTTAGREAWRAEQDALAETVAAETQATGLLERGPFPHRQPGATLDFPDDLFAGISPAQIARDAEHVITMATRWCREAAEGGAR